MKAVSLAMLLAMAAPAFAATLASPPPSTPAPSTAPVQDAKKTDDNKPFIYDTNSRPLPRKIVPKKAAGPGIG